MEKIEKVFITNDAFSEKGESELLPKLERLSRSAPWIIYISNRGGDLYSAFSIIDAINLFCKKSVGVVVGNCYSAAVDLLLSCDVRLCTPLSHIMIHETSLMFSDYERTSRLSEEVEMQKRIEDERVKVILKRTLIDKETLQSYIDRKEDMYFNSKQSLEWGLVDSLVKTEKDILSFINKK